MGALLNLDLEAQVLQDLIGLRYWSLRHIRLMYENFKQHPRRHTLLDSHSFWRLTKMPRKIAELIFRKYTRGGSHLEFFELMFGVILHSFNRYQ
jgi:hypothetical protein